MTADEDRSSPSSPSDSEDSAADSPPSPSDSEDPSTDSSTSTDDTSPSDPSPGFGSGSRPETEANGGSPSSSPSPSPVPSSSDGSETTLLGRLWTAKTGPWFVIREVLTSVAAVAIVGVLLFAVSGVWPPMVAVESGSMEPHMQKGDLVFITEPGRFNSENDYADTGVVTARTGADTGFRSFGGYGSVIVYDDPGRGGPPIIHRAEFYVESGENWYDEANPDYLGASSCENLLNCPAPHAGFITKGDANSRYDQASGIAPPVRPAWVSGIARLRIPYLGWVRLGLAGTVSAQGPAIDGQSEDTPVSAAAPGATPVSATASPVAPPLPVEQSNETKTDEFPEFAATTTHAYRSASPLSTRSSSTSQLSSA